jgi:hypothetical protein
VARLNHPDALAADNQAVALLPRREIQRVLLVTPGSHYLQRVLEAMPAVDLQVTSVPVDNVPADIVVVYHRHTPARLPRGKAMVIDPIQPTDAWTVGEELANPLVGKQQTASPLLTHVRMDNVWMPAARQIEFVREPQALISAVTGEALYSALESKEGSEGPEKLLVLTVDLEKGDLPLRTAFPILMTNALSWFQGTRGELREAIAAGSTYEVDLERGRESFSPAPALLAGQAISEPEKKTPDPLRLALRSPRGAQLPLPADQLKLTIGPLDQCGVWRIEPAAAATPSSPGETAPPPLFELAVNLASAAESDLRTPETAASISQADLAGLAGRPLWFYLALLAVMLICVEWWLYQRRWIS